MAPSSTSKTVEPVTVRFATPADGPELERLAALDAGRVPAGPALVAEVDGELVAALPLAHGRALADPFRPSAELLRLLELREAQLRGGGPSGRRRRTSSGLGGPRPVPSPVRS
jgi:hypothetical protein